MKKIAFSFLSAIATALCVSAATPQTYTMDVKDFGELQVVDPINVIHRCNPDSAGMAVFTTTPDVVSHIIFNNNKNKLKIQINSDETRIDTTPLITVYSSFINSVENSGDSTLIVDNPTPGATFKARIVGNGTLVIRNIHSTKVEGKLDTGKGHLVMTGVARTAELRNVGTGRIEAGGLKAENGSVTILGTGPVDMQVSSDLSVKGMGTGKVYLKGNPKVKNRSLGSIKVINLDEEAE